MRRFHRLSLAKACHWATKTVAAEGHKPMYGFGKIVFHSGRIELMSKLRQVISRKSYKAFIFMRGPDVFWTGQN
jgi:hypothetical protein